MGTQWMDVNHPRPKLQNFLADDVVDCASKRLDVRILKVGVDSYLLVDRYCQLAHLPTGLVMLRLKYLC